MQAVAVDPRDVSFEIDPVAYRVYFRSFDRTRFDEFRLTGAVDVREVIAWASARLDVSRSETYDLYAEIVTQDVKALVALSVVGAVTDVTIDAV